MSYIGSDIKHRYYARLLNKGLINFIVVATIWIILSPFSAIIISILLLLFEVIINLAADNINERIIKYHYSSIAENYAMFSTNYDKKTNINENLLNGELLSDDIYKKEFEIITKNKFGFYFNQDLINNFSIFLEILISAVFGILLKPFLHPHFLNFVNWLQ